MERQLVKFQGRDDLSSDSFIHSHILQSSIKVLCDVLSIKVQLMKPGHQLFFNKHGDTSFFEVVNCGGHLTVHESLKQESDGFTFWFILSRHGKPRRCIRAMTYQVHEFSLIGISIVVDIFTVLWLNFQPGVCVD